MESQLKAVGLLGIIIVLTSCGWPKDVKLIRAISVISEPSPSRIIRLALNMVTTVSRVLYSHASLVSG